MVVNKNMYLRQFIHNLLKGKSGLSEFYLYESYIHQNYHHHDGSFWDPNDYQDLQYIKAPGKGHCYFFIASIQGYDLKGFCGRENR